MRDAANKSKKSKVIRSGTRSNSRAGGAQGASLVPPAYGADKLDSAPPKTDLYKRDLDTVRNDLATLWDKKDSEQAVATDARYKGTFKATRRGTIWTRPAKEMKQRGPRKGRFKPGDFFTVEGRQVIGKGVWLKVKSAQKGLGYLNQSRGKFTRSSASENPVLMPEGVQFLGIGLEWGIDNVLEAIESLPENERAEHYLKLQRYVPYAGQRDNTGVAWSKKVQETKGKEAQTVSGRIFKPDGMCNVTSLAMAMQINGAKNPVTFNNDPKYKPKSVPKKARNFNISCNTRFEQFEDYIAALIWVKGWGPITKTASWIHAIEHFGLKFKQPVVGAKVLTKDEWIELRNRILSQGSWYSFSVWADILCAYRKLMISKGWLLMIRMEKQFLSP